MSHLVQSLRILAVGFGMAIDVAGACAGEIWPQRTVRVIVPNPPGVGIDVVARLFAERLGPRWGQPVIVENMPGADGIAAAREFVAKRDDHTLLHSFGGLISINPLMHDKLPYDPKVDIVPIAPTSENAVAIAVPTAFGARTLSELAQVSKSQPGGLTWAATPGIPYFAFAAFHKSTGGNMSQAAYRNFDQALIDLGEARIDVVAAGLAPMLPHLQSKKVRLIAFINRERLPIAPDVPTLAEVGYPNLPVSGPTGFFGWRDMPDALRNKIATDVRMVAADQLIVQRLANIGSVVRTSTPAEFVTSIEEQRAAVASAVQLVGVKPTR